MCMCPPPTKWRKHKDQGQRAVTGRTVLKKQCEEMKISSVMKTEQEELCESSGEDQYPEDQQRMSLIA